MFQWCLIPLFDETVSVWLKPALNTLPILFCRGWSLEKSDKKFPSDDFRFQLFSSANQFAEPIMRSTNRCCRFKQVFRKWYRLDEKLLQECLCRIKAAESVSFRNYCMWIFHFYKKLHMSKLSSKSNLYHNTSLSMSFGCWHLSGISLCPLHFTVYTIA